MLEVVIEAKTKEEAIRKVEEKLNANLSEIIYNIKEEKGKIFQGNIFKIKATTLSEIIKIAKEFIIKNTNALGLNISLEEQINNRQININMSSDNNQILIGKNGQTLKSLEILLKQHIINKYNYYLNLNLDVENYKEQRLKNLENLAIRTAKEVLETKIEVKLENMNSYERRIVHNALLNFNGISTISEGEDPNRHVIIKPTEKKSQ